MDIWGGDSGGICGGGNSGWANGGGGAEWANRDDDAGGIDGDGDSGGVSGDDVLCRSCLWGLCGRLRHGLVREYGLRRGDDLELGLTKGEVIVIGQDRNVTSGILLSRLHGPDAP